MAEIESAKGVDTNVMEIAQMVGALKVLSDVVPADLAASLADLADDLDSKITAALSDTED